MRTPNDLEPIRPSEQRNFEALRQLHLIVRSNAFNCADVARALLRHIVEETLAGRQPTEIMIALAVLGKDSLSYDPKKDRIVSSHIGKIRKRLAAYYESEGQSDAVVFSIPKGSYTVSMEFRTENRPSLRPQPPVLSTNSYVPAGLYSARIEAAIMCLGATSSESNPELSDVEERAVVGGKPSRIVEDDRCTWTIANYLLLPKVFEPWVSDRHLFVTRWDTKDNEQMVRIYKFNAKPYSPDRAPHIGEQHGKFVTAPICRSEINRFRSGRKTDYVPVRVEHLVKSEVDRSLLRNSGYPLAIGYVAPGPVTNEVMSALKNSRSIDCYAWFQTDHIASCPVTIYHSLAQA